ncbi:MAG: type I methionyl aminopeptidase [bacterium]|nr:type I methionyl aminopeptidase [bacterium]
MITIKTEKDLVLMAEGGQILKEILQALAQAVQPGVTTENLDKLSRELVFSYGQKHPEAHIKPSFLGYNSYPAYLCVSVNDEVVHGIPSDRVIHEGDLVGLDFGIIYHGWHTDSAVTVGVGEISKENQKLISVTREALALGIKEAKIGKTTGDIGYVIQKHIEKHGFGVVKELVGHGIGRKLHEPPHVPNYGFKGKGEVLKEGMTIAIEPMVTLGDPALVLSRDNWTYKTKDKSWSAHFEHTLAITKDGPRVLTG